MDSPSQPLMNDAMWASATFEASRREQLQEWARMTFTQKIEWLEEGHKLAMAFEKSRQSVKPIARGGSAERKN